ncbi:MAG TPA: DegT/DnrJ/EryC1/StrS family aminotransferase, partial [Syntrophobacteraceae bacterium]|nr:DegT/DnrJ/EryC1/StrS family aminotransferase [Syntrophobacteraceae bacterium]
LLEPLSTGWLTQGPKVAAFESAFAARHGVKHALATTSCTTALHIILVALGIGPGDEVIVPAFTWVATANVVVHCGATPVLVDVDRSTYNILPEQVRVRVTERTRAIIAVHLFGLCADIDRIASCAPGIPIIEDAACASGGAYKGRSAGSLGLAGAFSFHPRKTITTGEGGMVTTNDGKLAETINGLRNHGATVSEEQRHHGPAPHILPDFDLPGFNYRMTDLQGAVGLVQIGKLDSLIRERKKWAEYYNSHFMDVPWLSAPVVPDGYEHARQSYVCYVDEEKAPMPRNRIMDLLYKKGISTRPGTHAVHMLGYYSKRFGFKPDDLPGARDCDRFTIALPLHNRMTGEDFDFVVRAIKEIG